MSGNLLELLGKTDQYNNRSFYARRTGLERQSGIAHAQYTPNAGEARAELAGDLEAESRGELVRDLATFLSRSKGLQRFKKVLRT